MNWDESWAGRLGDLEIRVLAGEATDADVALYKELRDSHEEWIGRQPWFAEHQRHMRKLSYRAMRRELGLVRYYRHRWFIWVNYKPHWWNR